MRATPELIEEFRKVHPTFGPSEGMFGYFEVPTAGGKLRILSSGPISEKNQEWEHVSVSLPNRCPLWNEMQRVKELFWNDDEVVVQIHPPKADYVNLHKFCLHMWRHREAHTLPPTALV